MLATQIAPAAAELVNLNNYELTNLAMVTPDMLDLQNLRKKTKHIKKKIHRKRRPHTKKSKKARKMKRHAKKGGSAVKTDVTIERPLWEDFFGHGHGHWGLAPYGGYGHHASDFDGEFLGHHGLDYDHDFGFDHGFHDGAWGHDGHHADYFGLHGLDFGAHGFAPYHHNSWNFGDFDGFHADHDYNFDEGLEDGEEALEDNDLSAETDMDYTNLEDDIADEAHEFDHYGLSDGYHW